MMDKSVALAVFVKTPNLTPVKTRLAKSIGDSKAREVFHFLLDITRSTLQDLISLKLGVKVYWALAENESLQDKMWSDFPTLWQGEGGLGERLYNIQSQLFKHHEHIIFIGADAPFLTSTIIKDAIFRLRTLAGDIQLSKTSGDAIIGPSLDGGFYLYAAALERSLEQWTNITYSDSNTTTELLRSFGVTENAQFLRKLYDIDDLEDLKLTYHDLLECELKNLSPSHSQFLVWMQKNKALFFSNEASFMA
jgi:glycosyltransferase A (GT-A) superfamily protein (DUF2064 family)